MVFSVLTGGKQSWKPMLFCDKIAKLVTYFGQSNGRDTAPVDFCFAGAARGQMRNFCAKIISSVFHCGRVD